MLIFLHIAIMDLKDSGLFFETYVFDKLTSKSHPSVKASSNFKPRQEVYLDITRSIYIESPRGSRFFLLFKDECSKSTEVLKTLVKSKWETSLKFLTQKMDVRRTKDSSRIIQKIEVYYTNFWHHTFTTATMRNVNYRKKCENDPYYQCCRSRTLGGVFQPCVLLDGQSFNKIRRNFNRMPKIQHPRLFGIEPQHQRTAENLTQIAHPAT